MYQPSHFREERLDVQHALIAAHPLGLLISTGIDGLVANPLPFILDPAGAPLGVLRAHLARGNPQWSDLDGRAALVVFQGANSYVSPSWYRSKQATGKVVPTWNYAMVQARGIVRVRDDAGWLADQTATLTDSQERGRNPPWAVGDAPPEFIAAQLRGIVGLEIPISSIEGKWKVSQNRPLADRLGVAQALATNAESQAMAELVCPHGPR